MDRRTLISGSLAGAAIAVMTPLHAQSTQSVQNVATRFAGTLSAHDIDAFAALFSEHYINHQLSAAATPPAGVPNKTATVNFFRARLTGLPDLHVSIETTVIEGDKCAASFVYEGTHEGIFFGVAPTGKKLRFTSCDIFRVADGLIVEHWGMGDIAGVLAQLKG
ncbi:MULTISPECIES: ester cyclase [Paraburkholderia]|uniref:ester cyclase n=1 Tax=Paraburkholderia TaxID=1822464 RepID=UPI0022502DBA|nr:MULTISPECIES: ester cyclase [Paraburkholderia]MCX4159892.1 ester cyclase [Paraburkholderia megapolitana]MDN7155392.1 ester cyclase [Paraburkholderia sp. CHISQ3]MDQ6492436.1 ester cyclase [Paraburkholderia megapolitana]